MILIDNYDSFTYNIVQYLLELGVHPTIYYNDQITVAELETQTFERIILSPGAGNPDGAGISLDLIRSFYQTKKILGICLGHQCIAQFFGARVVAAREPMHGKTSEIFFDSDASLFTGIPQGFLATRYHSLVVEDVQPPLAANAQTSDGVIMATQHESLPIYGVQFHPEAILTEHGHQLLKNFLEL